MHPVLLHVGPLNVYSFGLMLSLGSALAVLVSFHNAKNHDLDPWLIVDIALYLFIVGLVVSRLLFVVTNWSYYAANPAEIFKTWEGGVSFYGAVLGGLLVVVVFAWLRKLSVGRLADTMAPGLALAASVGRLGCALNGCCYGVLTSGTWGVLTRFAPGLRHPTQLYESFAYLLVFVFLLRWQKRHARVPGQLFITFVGGYLVARYFVEFFREGDHLYPWLSVTQAASLVIGVLGVAAYLSLSWHARRAASAAPTGEAAARAAAGAAAGSSEASPVEGAAGSGETAPADSAAGTGAAAPAPAGEPPAPGGSVPGQPGG